MLARWLAAQLSVKINALGLFGGDWAKDTQPFP